MTSANCEGERIFLLKPGLFKVTVNCYSNFPQIVVSLYYKLSREYSHYTSVFPFLCYFVFLLHLFHSLSYQPLRILKLYIKKII